MPESTPPSAQIPDTAGTGVFAQTCSPDDLFSDDFTPLAEPVVELAHPSPPKSQPTAPSVNGSARRRPSNNVPSTPRSLNTSRPLTKQNVNDLNSPTSSNGTASLSSPKAQTHAAAVRGDRSATGGVAKPKLTEEELIAKMEAIKKKNTAIEEAHARSKADEESFQASEAAAKVRQKQERVNRQAMLSERERNAQRKIQAQQGRDWDASKEESDVVDRPHRRPMRGAHGGIARDGNNAAQGVEREAIEDASTGRGDFKGNRGRGRGAVRGARGGRQPPATNNQAQAVPSGEDFPVLGNAGAKYTDEKQPVDVAGKLDTSVSDPRPEPNRVDSWGAAVTPSEKKSWAEQMDDSVTGSQGEVSGEKTPKRGG